MAAFTVVVYQNGRPTGRNTSAETFDFLSVRVGPSGLEIKETSSHFDFSAKKLTNIAAGAATGEAVEYDQLNTALSNYVPLTQKGAASGVATLDAGGKIPASQLPSTVMEYQGVWNAATNTPALADGVGNIGDVYLVTVAGSQNLGSGSLTFALGDWVIYNGTIWQKSLNSNAVASVNGFTGSVVLTTTDVSEGSNLYHTDARARTAAVGDTIVDGVTDKAPSQNAVFDALAAKPSSTTSLSNNTGSTISTQKVVRITASGIALASNDADTSINVVGITTAAINDTASGPVHDAVGIPVAMTGLTAGALYYLDTAGGITVTPPTAVGTHVVLIGRALSTTSLLFHPQYVMKIAS